MYSPKISKDLIPRLYCLAKEQNMAMTKLVNQIIGDYLDKMDMGKLAATIVCSDDSEYLNRKDK